MNDLNGCNLSFHMDYLTALKLNLDFRAKLKIGLDENVNSQSSVMKMDHEP